MEVTFTLNEQKYTIRPSEVPLDTSLLVFIRSHARLTGTKFMCLEGGCGACVVNISGIKTPSGESQTIAVNSCLWPVYACNELNITTIEGVGGMKNGYHTVQKALHRYNGTQCGYCSPAMVMNMFSLLQSNGGKVTMQQVENSFGGSICRCTGYRPILDAFKSLAMDSCSETDIEDLTMDSCQLNEKGKRCSMEGQCNRKCHRTSSVSLEIRADDGKMWLRPVNLSALLKKLATQTITSEYMLVAGNTAHGVYRRSNNISVFIDIKSVAELHSISTNESSLSFGGNVSLTDFMETLRSAGEKFEQFSYARRIAQHIDLVASVPVRNAGTIAGNLSIKHAHNEFQSDVFLVLETIGAQLNIISVDGSIRPYSPKDYLSLDMHQKVILSIDLPKRDPQRFEYRSYKIMPRAQNAHAIVNAAFLFEFEPSNDKRTVKSCHICYGAINSKFIHAEATEKLLISVDDLCTNEMLAKAIKSLQNEINPDSDLIDPPAEYRRSLAIALFYRFVLDIAPKTRVKKEYASGSMGLERPLSSGSQVYQSDEKSYPLTQPLLKYEGLIQCTGEAEYVNDMFSSQTVDKELWAAFVPATQVHSKIVSIDATKALKIPGVEAFFAAKDIPGQNNFAPLDAGYGFFGEREVIFIEIDGRVEYYGQPCGVIVAKTMALANLAVDLVEIAYEKSLENRPVCPSVSHWLETNKLRQCENNTESTLLPNQEPDISTIYSPKIIQGDMEMGSQFHFTMEPQTTFCFPNDNGGINVYCATQWFDIVQVAISNCLKLPNGKVFGGMKRVGGGYGAKFSRSAQVACACALACHLMRRPVRFVMALESNMTTMGKRHPNAINYEATIDPTSGRLAGLSCTVVMDFGNSLNDDPSDAVLDSLKTSCYARRSEWKINVERLRTDSSSATWCRAPGSTEAIAIIENLMEHIARETNLDPAQVRLNNLDNKGSLHQIFPEFLKDTAYYQRKAEINEFNKQNRWRKRGIAVATMVYPLSYYTSFSVYIAIYHGDGTVVVSHSGSEMGQGINTKVAQVVAHFLQIPYDSITVEKFDSVIGANVSATSGSIGSELVCMSARKACETLLTRLKPIRDRMPKASWLEIIQEAFGQSIDLTQKEMIDEKELKPYEIIGCTCAEVEVDVLTGNIQILRVDIAEDVGNSMNPLVDVGQIEGAFIMGVGYWLTEKLNYDGQTGELVTNRTWSYKVPGVKDIPIDFRVKFLQGINNDGIFGSKATGEPAFNLAVVVVFALRHAIDAIHQDNGNSKKWYRLGTGNTPDVVFNAAEVNVNDFKLN